MASVVPALRTDVTASRREGRNGRRVCVCIIAALGSRRFAAVDGRGLGRRFNDAGGGGLRSEAAAKPQRSLRHHRISARSSLDDARTRIRESSKDTAERNGSLGSWPVSRWTSRGKSVRIWPVSAADSHKRMSLFDYQTTSLEPPSGEDFDGQFSVPQNSRDCTAPDPRKTPAFPHCDPSCVDFVCVVVRFRLHLRASLRRPSSTNQTRLRRESRHSCVCNQLLGSNRRYRSN